MSRKLSFVKRTWLIALILISGLYGCASPPDTKLSICTPESNKVNIYRVPPQSWTTMIFEFAYPTIPTSVPPAPPIPVQLNDPQIQGAQYAAFLQLISETKRWSDTETIQLDDSTKTRITLTFISPELLQAVFLNDVLKDHFLTSNFPTQLQNMLNSVADRDELLFLLTVTTTNNNNASTLHPTIKIPIKNMVLNNAENLTVQNSHDDHNLEQLIDTSADPVFGYLAYPLTQLSGSQCKWVLDPKYNTNIVITAPFITVDGVSNNSPYFWTIPYSSLISPMMPPNTPLPILPNGFDPNLMTPLTLPPNEINQADYWQNFARFVWNQVTLGNY